MWLGNILPPQTSSKILSFLGSLWFILFAIVFYIVLEIWDETRGKHRILSGVYNKLCRSVFDSCLKDFPQDNDKMRVSLFRADKGHLWNKDKTLLKMVGRHQTRNHPRKKCCFHFKPGEGCVGNAYETGSSFVRKCIEPYDSKWPETYYIASDKEFNLPKDKARKLNIKACDFLCLPVKFPGEDEAWGVLSLDSTEKDTFPGEKTTAMRSKINNILLGFSTYLDVV